MDLQDLLNEINSMKQINVSFQPNFPSKLHYKVAQKFSQYEARDEPIVPVIMREELIKCALNHSTYERRDKLSSLEILYGQVLSIQKSALDECYPFSRDTDSLSFSIEHSIPESQEVKEELDKRLQAIRDRVTEILESVDSLSLQTINTYVRISDHIISNMDITYDFNLERKLNDSFFRRKITREVYGSFQIAKEECEKYWTLNNQVLDMSLDMFDSAIGLIPIELEKFLLPVYNQLKDILPDKEQSKKICKVSKEIELQELSNVFEIYQ